MARRISLLFVIVFAGGCSWLSEPSEITVQQPGGERGPASTATASPNATAAPPPGPGGARMMPMRPGSGN